ncbi:MAG: S16 family serine protease [Bacillota bacterium]
MRYRGRIRFGGYRLLLTLVVSAVLALVGSLPSAYVLLVPGETRGVGPMITVQDEPGRETGFLMATVATRPASRAMALLSLVHPRLEARRLHDLVGEGRTLEEYYELNRLLMEESQALAILAAWRHLGRPVELTGEGALVLRVSAQAPAATVLRTRDVVVGVDAHPVRLAEDLAGYLAGIEPGQEVTLTVRREDQELALAVPTTAGRGRAELGLETLTVGITALGPRRITVDAGEVAGPSAGLAFALEIIDRLLPGTDLSQGGLVAVTGVLDRDGRVLAVGGVQQKTVAAEKAGARYFLVPAENAREASRAARAMHIVAVNTVQEAVLRLQALGDRSSAREWAESGFRQGKRRCLISRVNSNCLTRLSISSLSSTS